MDHEPLSPLLPSTERNMMAATYRKQRELNRHLHLKSLEEALRPLKESTGLDFYEMYQKRYNLEPAVGEIKEPLRNTVQDIKDLKLFFVDQANRTFYLYIEHRFHPTKPFEDCKDYVIMEEQLPKGKILTIFDYREDPQTFKVAGLVDKFQFRRLLGCYAISEDNSGQEKTIDLTSFWDNAIKMPNPNEEDDLKKMREIEAFKVIQEKYPGVLLNVKRRIENLYPEISPESDEFELRLLEELAAELGDKINIDILTDQNRVFKIGLANRRQASFSTETQIELVKQRGYFFFEDAVGTEKWLPFLYQTSSFSQDEGDKTETHFRTDLPLGAIRMLVNETQGNENDLVTQILTEANRYAEEQNIGLRDILGEQFPDQVNPVNQILQESRDWIRNRLAVTLYTLKKLHKMGIDLVPPEEYKELRQTINDKLKQLEQYSPGIGGKKPKFT